MPRAAASINWSRFVDIIHAHNRFLITSHIRPDADALGSELAMRAVLENLGKPVTIVNGHPTPPNLAFLDPQQHVRVLTTAPASELSDIDLVLILDTSAWIQLGPMADWIRASRAKKVVLDHHLSQDDLGAEMFKDPNAEATGRLVVDAANHLEVPLTPEMATALFAAVATDTGWFRFPSTTHSTYRLASLLIEAGANPSSLYRALYEQDSLGRLRLRGTILLRTVTDPQLRLAHTCILQADFPQTGALPTDTEDLVNLLLTVDGIENAALFVEQKSGGFKVSFRSQGRLDCSQVAASFGGGGHRAAAGAQVQGNLQEVQEKVFNAIRQSLLPG